MNTEKRKEHRLRAKLPIKIVYNGNKEMLAITENISRLGTYVEVDRDIPVGTALEVKLELPAYTSDLSMTGDVSCKGNVFRNSLLREFGPDRFYGIGIFFTDFAENQDRAKLSSYVDFLIIQEEQEIKEGVKRRKEKIEATKIVRHSEQLYEIEEKFQKETLKLLREMQAKLEEIHLLLKSDKKTK